MIRNHLKMQLKGSLHANSIADSHINFLTSISPDVSLPHTLMQAHYNPNVIIYEDCKGKTSKVPEVA
jgi:hypothetical protein